MILEFIEILDSNLTLTLEQLQTKVTNGDYDDLLNNYNLLIMISNGLVLINKDDKICKVIAPIDLENYVKNTDYASAIKTGVVKVNGSRGVSIASDNVIYTVQASKDKIDKRADIYSSIVPANLDYAVRSVYPITQTSITDPITVNTIYNLGVQTSLNIILPSGHVGDFIQFDFISKDIATTLSITSNNGLIGYDLIPEINKIYSLYFDWGTTGHDGTDVSYGWRFNYSEYSVDVV